MHEDPSFCSFTIENKHSSLFHESWVFLRNLKIRSFMGSLQSRFYFKKTFVLGPGHSTPRTHSFFPFFSFKLSGHGCHFWNSWFPYKGNHLLLPHSCFYQKLDKPATAWPLLIPPPILHQIMNWIQGISSAQSHDLSQPILSTIYIWQYPIGDHSFVVREPRGKIYLPPFGFEFRNLFPPKILTYMMIGPILPRFPIFVWFWARILRIFGEKRNLTCSS